MSESSDLQDGDGNGNGSGNAVWKKWTSQFRTSRHHRKHDLITEEFVDAEVERHMSLPTKKRSSLDDSDSDSDHDEVDSTTAMPKRVHPQQFLPSGFFSRYDNNQPLPVPSPDALPTCALRRQRHDGYDGDDDVIPPPPSFRRHASKKRAICGSWKRPDGELPDALPVGFGNSKRAIVDEEEEERSRGSFSSEKKEDGSGRFYVSEIGTTANIVNKIGPSSYKTTGSNMPPEQTAKMPSTKQAAQVHVEEKSKLGVEYKDNTMYKEGDKQMAKSKDEGTKDDNKPLFGKEKTDFTGMDNLPPPPPLATAKPFTWKGPLPLVVATSVATAANLDGDE